MTPTSSQHRLLREILRHYLTFEAYCQQSGQYVIEHKGMIISFLDLQGCLKNLSPRKSEAVFYNVILDWKQKDVAERMGITTVSVGQYVDHAMVQVSEEYWGRVPQRTAPSKPVTDASKQKEQSDA